MGQVTHLAARIAGIRQRDFRRMLAASIAAHIALAIAMAYQPESAVVMLPGVVSVELVAAAPGPAPRAVPAPAKPEPAPVPKPKPKPEPKPEPKPVPKQVVLPKEPSKPAPKPKAKAVAKPEPAPVERDLNDIMAELRADAGEQTPEPVVRPAAPTPAPAGGGGVGRPVSPEVAAWIKKAKIHVRQAWVFPAALRTQALEAHVLVDLDAQGNVIGTPSIVRRSGNPWYDEGVVRAIQKASPLPPPPESGEWAFVFAPQDSY